MEGPVGTTGGEGGAPAPPAPRLREEGGEVRCGNPSGHEVTVTLGLIRSRSCRRGLFESKGGSGSWCDHLGNDPGRDDSLGDIESLAGLLHAGQLADANIEGLLGVLGGPDVVVLLKTDQDLGNLHRAVVPLEDLHHGRSKRTRRRGGTRTTGKLGGAWHAIAALLATGARRTTAAARGLRSLEELVGHFHGGRRKLERISEEFMELLLKTLDFRGDLHRLLEGEGVRDGHSVVGFGV